MTTTSPFGGSSHSQQAQETGRQVLVDFISGRGAGPPSTPVNKENIPSVGYGAPIHAIYGNARVSCTLMWAAPINETKTVEEVESGGKGGSSTSYQRTTSLYDATFAQLIGQEEIVGISRIWLNGKIFYENRPYLTGKPLDAANNAENFFTLYRGTNDQVADTLMAAAIGADNTPAYRGRSYIVFKELQLADYGNRIPQVDVEVVQWGTGAYNETVAPMPISLHYIIGDIMTRCGFDSAEYDATQLTDLVDGYIADFKTDSATIIDNLSKIFNFYYYNDGQKLIFAKHPSPVRRVEHNTSCMINEDYLIGNGFHDQLGRQGYFPHEAGTSEGQFLMIRAACQAYHATTDSYWLTLATSMGDAATLMYKQDPPSSGSGILYTPHWLYVMKKPVQAQSFILCTKIVMTSVDALNMQGTIPAGPGYYGDLTVKVTNLYDNENTFLTWPNPYAATIGTEYGEPVSIVASGSGCLVTATKAQLGTPAGDLTVNVAYIVNAGPMLATSEMMEAWPNWRQIESGEIDCAVDTLPWAYEAFDLLYALTAVAKWNDAKIITGETVSTIFDVDDGRTWIKQVVSSPFALPGTYISSTRPGFNQSSVYTDENKNINIYAPQGSGEVQFGRGLTDQISAGDTHIRVILSSNPNKTVDFFLQDGTDVGTADRYYYQLSLTSTLTTTDIPLASFSKRQLTGAGWTEVGTGLPALTTIDVVGLIYEGTGSGTIVWQAARPIPEVQLPYTVGVAPYTANSVDGQLLDWRGYPGVGYQDPMIWDWLSQAAYLTLMVDFIEDSQNEYNTLHSVLGPFIPSYAWDRYDSLDIGATADTWTWLWADPNSEWVGYTARVVAACARTAWKNGDSRCNTIALNFLTWLNTNWTTHTQYPPTNFPASIATWAATTDYAVDDIVIPTTPNGKVYKCTVAGTSSGSEPTWPTTINLTVADNTVTWQCSGYTYGASPVYGNYDEPHAVALWMRAAGYLHANGTSTALMVTIMTRCWDYLEARFQPTDPMGGTWSSNPAGGEWYGFWGAEIMSTLSLLLITPDATVDDGLDAQRTAASISSVTVASRIASYKTWLSSVTRSVTVDNITDVALSDDYTLKKSNDKELPNEVTLSYLSKARNGTNDYRYSRSLAKASINKVEVSALVVMEGKSAQSFTLRKLLEIWSQENTYSYSQISRLFDPGDVIELVIDGDTIQMQLKSLGLKGDGSVDIEAISYDPEVYVESSQDVFDSGTSMGLSSIADTLLQLLDIALIEDAQDYSGYYSGAKPTSSNWQAGAMYSSNNGGASYQLETSYTGGIYYGVTDGVLASASANIMDLTSTVQVTMANGTLSSVTEADLFSSHKVNLILIGNELVQFQTATLGAPGVYTLSNLLRGRRGTEGFIYGHVLGETVVLINGFIKDTALDTSLIGVSRLLKGVTAGQNVGDVTASSATINSSRLKPYSPAHLASTRAASGQIDLTWERRARTNGGWNDNVDVPLDEISELYRVKLYDALPSASGNLLATFDSSVKSYTLSPATIDLYYATATSTVYLSVNQVSGVVGDGYITEKTIT